MLFGENRIAVITFARHSLKTRITIASLTIFLIGVWSLSIYASRMLRHDMEQLLGEQQFSTVSLAAAQLDRELTERLAALAVAAGRLGPALAVNAAALQQSLERSELLLGLFNGGITVLRLDGLAIADVPLSARRFGANYMEVDAVVAALRKGKAMIGRPIMGKKLQAPIFAMVVPLYDKQGKVSGALAGVTNLGLPNFLDKIVDNRYGKTGGYLLIAPQYRLVVTASDKNRIMESLPAAGSNQLIDRFIDGYEGSAVMFNPLGAEVLASDKGVAAAGWILSATLPTAEAFAPIHGMLRRVLIATIFLTLLAGSVTWWILRRQLSPMLAAAATLKTLSAGQQPPGPLPISSEDEIGELIAGFNHLLATLAKRETALRASKSFASSILDSVAAEIAVLDHDGVIVEVNQPWRSFALANGAQPGQPSAQTGVGVNYLTVCRAAIDSASGDAAAHACAGIRAVLDGAVPSFSLEYPCDTPQQRHWFSLIATPVELETRGAVVAHTNITERKQAENALRESEQRFRSIADAAPLLIWISASDRRCFWFSRGWLEFTGRGIGQELDDGWTEGLHPDDRQHCLAIYNASFDRRRPFNMEYRLRHHSGEYRWIHDTGMPRFDAMGEFLGYIGSCADVSETRMAQERLAAMTASVPGVVYQFQRSTTGEWKFLFLSKGVEELFEVTAAAACLNHRALNERILPEDRVAHQASIERSAQDLSFWEHEYRIGMPNGSIKWVRGRAMPQRQDDGGLVWNGILTDVTAARRMEEQVRHMAFYDPLTELPNRRLLKDRLSQSLASNRRSGCYGGLMFLDLDNFKPLNDGHGHDTGDLLLIEAAQRLKSCVRAMDTVARFGGDEFVVMISELDVDREVSQAQAGIVAEKIRVTLAQPYLLTLEAQGEARIEHHCTASIGITLFQSQDAGQDEILKRADAAMYRAKKVGRDSICFDDAQSDVTEESTGNGGTLPPKRTG